MQAGGNPASLPCERPPQVAVDHQHGAGRNRYTSLQRGIDEHQPPPLSLRRSRQPRAGLCRPPAYLRQRRIAGCRLPVFVRRAEMHEHGRLKPFHSEGCAPQAVPDLPACHPDFGRRRPIAGIGQISVQGRGVRQGQQQIAVEVQRMPRLKPGQRPLPSHLDERRRRFGIQPDQPRVDLHRAVVVNRVPSRQFPLRRLVQKRADAMARIAAHIDAVVCAHLRCGGSGHAGHPAALERELQVVEDQQDIPRCHQHTRGKPPGQPAQADQELIENRGRPPVGQNTRHTREQLPRGRRVRQPPGIPAGVDQEHSLRPGRSRAGRKVLQHPQRGAPGADPPAVGIGKDLKARAFG